MVFLSWYWIVMVFILMARLIALKTLLFVRPTKILLNPLSSVIRFIGFIRGISRLFEILILQQMSRAQSANFATKNNRTVRL